MPNSNKSLHDALEILDLTNNLDENIKYLKDFLGPKGYKVTPNEETRKRAEDLYKILGLPVPVEINLDGEPDPLGAEAVPLKSIIDVAKYKLATAEALQKINAIKDDEDLTSENYNYLITLCPQTWPEYDAIFKKFCKDNFLQDTNPKVEQSFQSIYEAARVKYNHIVDKTEIRSADKVNELAEVIKTKQDKLAETLKKLKAIQDSIAPILGSISQKQQEINKKRQAMDIELKDARDKARKEAIKESISQMDAEKNLLDVTEEKLSNINARLQHRYNKAAENIGNKLELQSMKINQKVERKGITWEEDANVVKADKLNHCVALDRSFYVIENGNFKYKVIPSLGANPIVGTILLSDLGLNESSDFQDEDVQQKINAQLVARNHLIEKYEPFKLGDPKFGIAADEKAVTSIGNIFDDLAGDVARCERVVHLAEMAANDPGKQLHSNQPVNAFVEVMSLADICSFNEQGLPYFIDEIIDKNTQKPRQEKDSRLQYGLEGEVITRGVMLRPGEIKRSSYVTYKQDGSIDPESKIVIDTSLVKSKETKEYSVAKVTYTSKGALTQEEKKLAAFRFARELLRQYTEGDCKNPINIKAGVNADADAAKEQATLVYAALMMLTSPENKGDDYIHLPNHMLNIDVKGVGGPDLLEWPWKRKQEFINKYFGDEKQRKEMRSEVTSEYRSIRSNFMNNEKKAKIVDNAADDIHYTQHKIK